MLTDLGKAIRDDIETLIKQAEDEYGADEFLGPGEYGAGYIQGVKDALDVVFAHTDGGAEPNKQPGC